MDNETKLPDIHIFQDSDSSTCGPSCLAMVYAMKGKQITRSDVLHDFKHGEKGEASYTPQLARHLLANNLPNRMIIAGSTGLLPSWRDLPKEEVINNLKTWLTLHPQDVWQPNNLHLLFYLQEGGEARIQAYTASTLKNLLDKGSTLILCIDETWVWEHRLKLDGNKRIVDDLAGMREGHFVVVTGYKDDKFHVLDPFPTHIKGRHGAYDIDENELVNASLTWDPEIIEVLA